MAKKKEKKEKKAGKRMSKKELAALLIDFFHAKSSEILSMKYIFSELRLTTHPQKMLCVDILHDLLDDDYISEIEKGKFRLNNHGTEMIGTFQRKSNGKNSFIPEEGGEPVFVAERNSAHAMNKNYILCQTKEQGGRRGSNRNTGTCQRHFCRYIGSSQVIRISGNGKSHTCQ